MIFKFLNVFTLPLDGQSGACPSWQKYLDSMIFKFLNVFTLPLQIIIE